MIAALCEQYGPPESLVLRELPDPAPGPGEVLVEPSRVALNFFDTLIIENKYQVKPALPFSPGGEFCGKVVGLGEGVEGLSIGQRVAGYCSHGAARSRLVLPASSSHRRSRCAERRPGRGAFHHLWNDDARFGRSGPICGRARPSPFWAPPAASAWRRSRSAPRSGAHVIACASSPEKLDFAQRHGAHEGLDYSPEDLKEGLKLRTGGKGVDCVYDAIGGAFSEAALRAMAWNGRFLVVGFASGEIPKIPLNLPLLKGCAILGVFWGEFVKREPEAHRQNMARIFDWAARGIISAHVDEVLPLHDIAKALNLLKERKARGKILLSIP